MLVGLPGSGKSTHAKELSIEYNANIHSSDEIREELLGDVNNQTNQEGVFTVLHNRIKDDLSNNINVVYDACNIKYRRRMAFLRETERYGCDKICILIGTSYQDCLANNIKRDRQVPEEAIERMYRSFDIPYWYEGWDDIRIKWNSKINGIMGNFIREHMNYDQSNPHHSYSLGKHCDKAYSYAFNNSRELSVRVAAGLHDCGKPFCKTFITHKGELTEIAHYYNHEYVGSYNSLFMNNWRLNNVNNLKLDIAIIIRWHMMPYVWEKDANSKLHDKYKRLWGEDLYEKIMIIHEADKAAH